MMVPSANDPFGDTLDDDSQLYSQSESGTAVAEPQVSQQAAVSEAVDVDVLIMEDDDLQRELLTRNLESLNIQVWSVATVTAAMQALVERTYRLAIFDIHVPDGNGLELCEYIDSEPRLCGLPVIIISSHPQDDIVRKCRAAGACFFLSKPYDPNVLLALVEKAIGLEST